MPKKVLEGVRIAVLAADGFEQVELTRPAKALRKAGATVEIVSLHSGSIRGMNHMAPGKKVEVDHTVLTADPAEYDGLHIPGGLMNPDSLRQSEMALDFVRAFETAGRPIATICHGPWVLISAGLAEGRRLASWRAIRDDVVNAGAEWVDEAVVRDRNWISSRHPGDLPQFDRAIVEHFARALGREMPEESDAPEWGLLVGTLAAGAVAAVTGYAVRRALLARRGDEAYIEDAPEPPRMRRTRDAATETEPAEPELTTVSAELE
jgi:protease I